MQNIQINVLLNKINNYTEEEINLIKKAYYYAENKHKGQFRQSGEEYITHPLNVACILADMHADADTICAGLLHDVLEDTNTTKQDLKEEFNSEIAKLVNGVTKISKMNFSTKTEEKYANTRKIITGITEDVRIIIIKLADRLHNMRTLEYKKPYKQKENSFETLEIFVPLAHYIGAYRIKSELEDIAFSYLRPTQYKKINDLKIAKEKEYHEAINEMLYKISNILSISNIPNEIKIRTLNVYGIYKRKFQGKKIKEMHDFIALKIMVNTIDECYLTLGKIHSLYNPLPSQFKDYIYNPKANLYRSIHTTVFGTRIDEENRLVQAQIRTFEMDEIASFGLTAYWNKNREYARLNMQEALKKDYQFYDSLIAISKGFEDNQIFLKQVKDEIFRKNIYVYTTKGEVIELPQGSTPIDFAYKLKDELGNKYSKAFVNDKPVSLNYILQDNDIVRITTDDNIRGPNESWKSIAKTTLAKTKILDNQSL